MQKRVTGSNGESVVEPDVVVVGGGGAGLAAASAAAELGARVVLIEKGASLGGSTAWSVGSITATGTPHQRRAGIADSTDAHFEDLGLLAGNKANRDNLALRRILVDETPKAFDWLLSTGLVFTGPNAEPPHRTPRMHNVLPNSRAFPAALGRHCRRLGVEASLYQHGAILVNTEGRRFADELDNPQDALPDQPGAIAFAVLDGAIAEAFSRWPNFVSTAPGVAYAYIADYRRNRRDVFHEAPSLEMLAQKIGVSADALARTVAETNARAAAAGRAPLARAPYIALGPIKPYVVFTDGGLAVSERLEVTGSDGAPIPGLYAAGSTGQGGVLLNGHGHHLGWAFVSGRIAGRVAAGAAAEAKQARATGAAPTLGGRAGPA